MSDSSLPTNLPTAEDLSRREAASLANRVSAAMSTGAVRETPAAEVALDTLRNRAAQPITQAQRDASRAQARPAPFTGADQASQRAQAVAQNTARARL